MNLGLNAAWQWEWLQYADQCARDAYPDIVNGRFLISPYQSTQSRPTGPQPIFQHKERVTKGLIKIQLSLVALSSRSLKIATTDAAENCNSNDLGKSSVYRTQFVNESKTLIGITEARTKRGTRHSKTVFLYSSGSL